MWREIEKSCRRALFRPGQSWKALRGPAPVVLTPGVSSHRLVLCSLLIILLAGCAQAGSLSASGSTLTGSSHTPDAAPVNLTSSANFTFSGGQNANYTLRTTALASELRHGHREFTILLTDTGVSLFIAFYGYQGPGSYTLTNAVNAGNVHIGFDHDTISWDLLMRPAANCSLHIASDVPTSRAGLDRMRGTFACPLLLSSSPHRPQKPVTVSSGSFDIAMLVAS